MSAHVEFLSCHTVTCRCAMASEVGSVRKISRQPSVRHKTASGGWNETETGTLETIKISAAVGTSGSGGWTTAPVTDKWSIL